jgi:hypothetical protein
MLTAIESFQARGIGTGADPRWPVHVMILAAQLTMFPDGRGLTCGRHPPL